MNWLTGKVATYLGGGLVAALLVALLIVTITKNHAINLLSRRVTELEKSLQGCNAARATLQANQAGLEQSIARQNSSIDDVVAKSDANYRAAAVDRQQAEKQVAEAAAKQRQLQTAKRGADLATSTDALILESLK